VRNRDKMSWGDSEGDSPEGSRCRPYCRYLPSDISCQGVPLRAIVSSNSAARCTILLHYVSGEISRNLLVVAAILWL
jgi:hypothetical protein